MLVKSKQVFYTQVIKIFHSSFLHSSHNGRAVRHVFVLCTLSSHQLCTQTPIWRQIFCDHLTQHATLPLVTLTTHGLHTRLAHCVEFIHQSPIKNDPDHSDLPAASTLTKQSAGTSLFSLNFVQIIDETTFLLILFQFILNETLFYPRSIITEE